MAPTATAYRVFNRGNTGFCVGQIVGVVGGLPADMVNVMQPTSDPLPPGSFMIDAARAAREAAESAAAFQATSKPDRLLTSEELQEKYPPSVIRSCSLLR